MQSVPSHFSTCTNTGDLETLRKFLLTSYRPGLNGLKRANCSEITLETSNAPFPIKTSPPSAAIKALLLSQQGKGTVSTATRPLCQAAPGQKKPTQQDRELEKSPDDVGGLL